MLDKEPKTIFTLNGGSSSIKFSLYAFDDTPELRASGMVDAIGSETGSLVLKAGDDKMRRELGKVDLPGGLRAIAEAVQPLLNGRPIDCIGHRIVHGGTKYAGPAVLDETVLSWLEQLVPFAPLHQPHNLAGVRAAMARFPDALQVGCFDTAFHRGHSFAYDTFALPRRYYEAGIRRYGFHGLSYTYISGRLKEIDPDGHHRTVVCHLGNGASICAMLNGRSVASSMGFSALDGLPMGSRCGQLDPGVILYMLDQEGMTSAQITEMLYKQSGLLGISGLSNDMRELESAGTEEARQAIDYFVFRIRRELGAMAAILGGLDTLVFCGGIGENSAMIRDRVCENMEWLGIELDPDANVRADPILSRGTTRVRVIRTDEEQVIAAACADFLESKQVAPEMT